MIKCYFGVPGCGKTTILTKTARRELKKLKKRYNQIYTINFECKGTLMIRFSDLANYKFENCLILIDEITMDADNRNFKSFPSEIRDFFILHRHLGVDIIYATQNFENVDKKIRDLTSELWYMSKSVIPILKEFTTSKRIYRKININEYTSDLTLGYRFCNFIEGLFASNFEITFRRKYYKYFDSYDQLSIADRPLYPYTIKNKTKLEVILNGFKRKRKNNNKIEKPISKYLNDTNKH